MWHKLFINQYYKGYDIGAMSWVEPMELPPLSLITRIFACCLALLFLSCGCYVEFLLTFCIFHEDCSSLYTYNVCGQKYWQLKITLINMLKCCFNSCGKENILGYCISLYAWGASPNFVIFFSLSGLSLTLKIVR